MTATNQPSAAVQVTPEMAQKLVLDIIQNMDDGKVVELLAQFKAYAQAMPDEARYLLLQNPQLSYALLQGAIRANLLDKTQADVCIYPILSKSRSCLKSHVLLSMEVNLGTRQIYAFISNRHRFSYIFLAVAL